MDTVLVSIHAPARGATRIADRHGNAGEGVSIHAPARGATAPLTVSVRVAHRFNPRARAGRDRRERNGRGRVQSARAGFNPRARAGRDSHKRNSIVGMKLPYVKRDAR